jgi:RNA polymerase-binding protein DksA
MKAGDATGPQGHGRALSADLLQGFRDALQQREQVLGGEVRAVGDERAELLAEARRSVNDLGDEAEGRREDEVRAAEQQRDAVELAEIDAALRRLDEGRYGECIDCGVAIPLPRLQARPSVARCIDCQQRYEKAAGMVA